MSERAFYVLSLLTPLLGAGLIALVLLMTVGCAASFALYPPWYRPPNTTTSQAPPDPPQPTPAPTADPNGLLLEYLRSLQPSPSPSPDVQPVPSPAIRQEER